MKWIIEMPQEWKPEIGQVKPGDNPHCATCPFRDAKQDPQSEWYDDDLEDFCIPGQCPLANAKEAVEVCKEEVHHDIIEEKLTDDLGKRVKLYAVAVDKKGE